MARDIPTARARPTARPRPGVWPSSTASTPSAKKRHKPSTPSWAQVSGEAESSPWIAEVPPELIAGFVSARRALNRFSRVSTSYRHQLEDSPTERLLRQLRAEKRDRSDWTYYQQAQATLWLGARGSECDHWIPLDENGRSLFEDRQDCVDRAQYWVRKYLRLGDDQLGWHDAAFFVPLSDGDLFALAEQTRRASVARTARPERPERPERPGRPGRKDRELARFAGDRIAQVADSRTAVITKMSQRATAERLVAADREKALAAFLQLLERIDPIALCEVPRAPALDPTAPSGDGANRGSDNGSGDHAEGRRNGRGDGHEEQLA